MALSQIQIEQLYVSYFGRPADFQGVQFYLNNNSTADQVAATFAASAESKSLFGSLSTPQLINAIYQNLFNRDAEVAGLTYWTNVINSGLANAASVALAIGNGAQGADQVAVANKVTIASNFTTALGTSTANILGYSGDAAAASARAFIKTVDSTTASVTTATNGLSAAVASAVALGGVAGTIFTLTTAADSFIGGTGNDVFNTFIDGTTAANSTISAADSINGGAGIDTLNVTLSNASVALPAASISNVEIINVRAAGFALAATDLSTLGSAVTTFNSDRSTAGVTVTNLAKGGSFGVIGDGTAGNVGTLAFGYASGADAAILNIGGGVKGTSGTTGPAVTVTGSGVLSTTINVTGSVANQTGVITNAATSKATTINASSNLTAIGGLVTTADTKLTVTGTGTVNLSKTTADYDTALNNAIVTIDASAMTAGGLKVLAGNSTTIKFTGGAGADGFGLGAVLATGAAVDGGAGTDTLYVGGNSAYVTSATGAFIKNFEIVDVTTATIDLDNLSANNTLTGLRVGGSATVSNINAATAGAVTVYANATPVLNVKGSTNSGQLDTVSIDVNDGATAVNTITLTAPTLTGVETLKLNATDNITVTSLANSLALTAITVTGAANTSITTTAIALNPNTVVDASAATGNFTLDATGATANGYTIKGSAGTNIITGGSAPVIVDLTKSVAKADQLIITSATGSNINAVQQVSGFTNATSTGDKLDVINTGVVAANVAAGTATGVTNLTAQITNGVITFAGSAATTATFTDKVNAAATLAGTTQYTEVAFEHAGNTYVFEQGDTTATYAAGVDLIVQLTGVTGVTTLSATASGANTVWAV
ncbi:MAG: DUF4214 domain-containing protein [Pseudomonadota bacterium]